MNRSYPNSPNWSLLMRLLMKSQWKQLRLLMRSQWKQPKEVISYLLFACSSCPLLFLPCFSANLENVKSLKSRWSRWVSWDLKLRMLKKLISWNLWNKHTRRNVMKSLAFFTIKTKLYEDHRHIIGKNMKFYN